MEDEKNKGNIKGRKVINLITNDGFGWKQWLEHVV
jgi:hypothetical protein